MNIYNKALTQIGITLISLTAIQLSAIAEVAKPGNYIIDASHSTILFKTSHLGYSEMTGRFNTFEGNLTLNKSNSSMKITIQSKSIDTNHAKRDKHLRSPDFFNVKQFPEIDFVSNEVSVNDLGEPIKISGTMTLHGKSNNVSFAVTPIGAGKDPWGGYRAGYNASAIIKRSDYGMSFMQGAGIGDKVEITLNIETMKQ